MWCYALLWGGWICHGSRSGYVYVQYWLYVASFDALLCGDLKLVLPFDYFFFSSALSHHLGFSSRLYWCAFMHFCACSFFIEVHFTFKKSMCIYIEKRRVHFLGFYLLCQILLVLKCVFGNVSIHFLIWLIK